MQETTVKWMLVAYQIYLLANGIVLGLLGAHIEHIYGNYYHLIHYTFELLGVALLLACKLTIFTFVFGLCGALNRSSCVTITFTVLLVFVIISNLGLGMGGFYFAYYSDDIHSYSFMESLRMYKSQWAMSGRWDSMQSEYNCCGVEHYRDWAEVFNNSTLPLSCCSGSQGNGIHFECKVNSNILRPEGCLYFFGYHLGNIQRLIGFLGIVSTLTQTFGLVFSIKAAKIFRKFNVYR